MKNIYLKMTSRFFLTLAIMLGMLNLSKAQGIAGAIVLSEIKNCVQTSPTEIEFEYWIQNVATNGETQKLNAVTFGLNYNTAISTGTCLGSLVSLNPAFGPNIGGSTNVVTNPATGYMRYNSGLELVANALVIPTAAPGLYFGKFKITASVPFSPNVAVNFAFQAANAGVRARHLVNIFRNTNTTANGYVFSGQGVNNGTGTGAYCTPFNTISTCADIYNTPITQSACASYTWNGTTYTQSGTYTSVGTPQAAPCAAFNTYDILNLTIVDPGPQPSPVNCWDNYVLNTTTCTWDNTGSQPVQPPVVNCWDNFVFNTTSCTWDNTGSQPAQPPIVNCWDNFVFNTTSCAWDNTGSQPAQPPVVNCWDNFVFNTTSCAWDNTGSQPAQPPIVNCWDNFVFNTTSCAWDNTGSQPAQPPIVNCWDNFVFNATSCAWDNTGSQPAQPPVVNCWDNFVFNTTSCTWDNTGSQPAQPPVVNCWDNFVFNTTSCAWDNTGTQPQQPNLLCYQSATFNTGTCTWDVTGTPGYNTPMQVTAAGSYNFCGTTYTSSGIYTCNTLNTNPCGYDILDLTITSCTVAVTASNVNVCSGATIDLLTHVTPSGTGGSFNVPNPSIFPVGATSYTYTYIDPVSGCAGSATANITVATLQNVTGFTNTGSTGTTATFSWNAVSGAAWYTIRYRIAGTSAWTYSSVNVPATTKTIVGLTPGASYEAEIRANCNVNNQGVYGSFITFGTTAPCPAPSNIVATPVTGSNGTKLLVTFTQNSTTGWNLIRYRLASTAPTGTWSVISPAAAAGTTITGLTPNSAYEIQVQSKCSTFDISTWTPGSGTTGVNPSKGIDEAVETYVSAVSIYPNPTRDILNIEVTSAENASTVVKVFDISGRLVKQVQANTEVGVNNLVIDLKDVSAGMYTLQVYENNKLTNVTKVNKQD